ncbi:MAG: DUF4399 domain-containing protein [Woeseia sp.]
MAPTVRLVLPFLLLAGACSQQPDQASVTDPAPSKAAPIVQTMPRTAAPADARLYFVGLADGAVVSSPLQVSFGLDGMTVVPAGTDAPASGHHHLIIDAPLPAFDRPIPADANHVHFGTGATSTTIELTPGQHSLQLLLGDYLHIPHQPPVVSEKIQITVE